MAAGYLTLRDLFSLQRVDLVHLARTIRHTGTLENLWALRSGIRKLVDDILAHGASSMQIIQLVTALLNEQSMCWVIECV